MSLRDVQLRLAESVTGLDATRLAAELNGNEAVKAFEGDLELGREYGASGFPTLLFRRSPSALRPEDDEGILVGGHRTSQTYLQAVNRVSPGLAQAEPRTVSQVLAAYGPLTTRELSEIQQNGSDEARREMETLVSTGEVRERKVRGGEFWELVPKQ